MKVPKILKGVPVSLLIMLIGTGILFVLMTWTPIRYILNLVIAWIILKVLMDFWKGKYKIKIEVLE